MYNHVYKNCIYSHDLLAFLFMSDIFNYQNKQSGTENYIYVDLGVYFTICVAFECFRKKCVDYL